MNDKGEHFYATLLETVTGSVNASSALVLATCDIFVSSLFYTSGRRFLGLGRNIRRIDALQPTTIQDEWQLAST